jgi:hypothetical protein
MSRGHRLVTYRNQDSEPQDRGIRRSGRRQAPATAAPVLCTRACADSKPPTPAGQPPCELPWRVRRKPGWKLHKCLRATWCLSCQNALWGLKSASRYRLRWIIGSALVAAGRSLVPANIGLPMVPAESNGRPLGPIPKRVFDPLHGRMFRVLHLDPIRRRAAAIGAVRCFDTRPSSPNSQALRSR